MQNTRVVTGKVRLSYCHIWEAHSSEPGKEARFSTAILIPKTDLATIQKINAAIEAAKVNDASKLQGANGQLPYNMKLPLRDGDMERPEDPAYQGMLFLNAVSKQRPEVVDLNLNAVLVPAEVYSGCWARVSINFYGFKVNGNTGIAVGLGNIQKLSDGEPLSGGASASDDFGDNYVDQAAYSQPAPQYHAPAQPVQQVYQAPAAPVYQQPQQPVAPVPPVYNPNQGNTGGGLLD